MNRSALKTYAPKARKEFIQAVTDRAAFYGLTKGETQAVTVKGDIAIIGGKAFPRSVAEKRRRLEDRIERQGPSGFEQVMEAVAYTWFNRLVAIRYMELHGYLDHGYRVLSHPEGKSTPEIVEHAEHVELSGGGVNQQKVIDLKLDGTKESELFRMLLIAQCNALHSAMPFLFERIDDETELLLPDNLLHSDSIVRKLVSDIDEADWKEVEIIGWLYQFYISDKKDEVIGKVVKSEDIPAATQLFTPNWIVKYLVQNSLGRQWLATYPDSTLKARWQYYIAPAEQTPEVQAKLKETTPATLNPEELTIMDPACGSGHILVEAYDLFKDIYLERGYRLRDIPRLILTKNVFGLEIDDRAAQLSCFALMMKAREDDRRIFDPPPQLNVLAIQESNGLPVNTIVQAFTEKRITKDDDLPAGEFGFMVAERAPLFAGEAKATPAKADEQVAADLKVLLALFENAKTYGSLITVPPRLAERLPMIADAVQASNADPNLAVQNAARIAGGFVMTATLLAKRYDAVAANPPYMGDAGFSSLLKARLTEQYSDFRSDLFAAFIARMRDLVVANGHLSAMTPFVWMSLQTYEPVRELLLTDCPLQSVVKPEYHAFFDSAFVPICAFATQRGVGDWNATVIDLSAFVGEDEQPKRTREALINRRCGYLFERQVSKFRTVPSQIIAYAMPDSALSCFGRFQPLSAQADFRQGLITGDNNRFLRFWHEVSLQRFACKGDVRDKKWMPYQKGGALRRWYGNHEYVVNWERDGEEIRSFRGASGKLRSRPQNLGYFFRDGASWTSLTVSALSMRYVPPGFIFDAKGPMCFARPESSILRVMALLNTRVATLFLRELAPTMDFSQGPVGSVPAPAALPASVDTVASNLVKIHEREWNESENSWGFSQDPVVAHRSAARLREAVQAADAVAESILGEVSHLEDQLETMILEAYSLDRGVLQSVALLRPTLTSLSTEQRMRRLLSYSFGCAIGRYSLDKPGLIYANSGNDGFDLSQYKAFPADPDGIIPLTEFDWFPDSAARRFEEFVGVAWPKEHLEENLQFVAESLAAKSGDEPREVIRRYFANDFYKHHLQTYKKRPIYWLFSSGKQRAFQALVYLHRYHEGTLARMRTEYVIPLQGKIASRISQLEGDAAKATSSAHTKKLTKEKDNLVKQQAELREFDEKLRHYADQRIKLDLDDGVKVNYGKFGDLLAEVKAICGEKEDEE